MLPNVPRPWLEHLSTLGILKMSPRRITDALKVSSLEMNWTENLPSRVLMCYASNL